MVENCIYTNLSGSKIKKARNPETLAGGCLLWFRNRLLRLRNRLLWLRGHLLLSRNDLL